jgi:hypothetical protein
VLLEVKGLRATVAATGQEILQGVDLTVREGEARTLPPACSCPQALRLATEQARSKLLLRYAGAGTCSQARAMTLP